MDNDVLTVLETGKQYNLKPLGEVGVTDVPHAPTDSHRHPHCSALRPVRMNLPKHQPEEC